MNLEAMKRLIAKYQYGHTDFVIRAETGERYYRNETDIMFKEKKSEEEKTLRNADNRIPRNFHGLIVNQKAAYAFTVKNFGTKLGSLATGTIEESIIQNEYV